jgi:peptide/nickel transport system substrate-binding protein
VGAQTPRKGGTVTFGPVFESPCLNRLVTSCYTGDLLLSIAEKVLQPAFDVGPRFTFRPRLVSGVTVTKRPPFTLTYRIRPEARWSDGVPVSAGDFVFTHEARIARKASLPEDERDLLDHVRSVTAVDAKTVRVVLRSRFAGWHGLFPNVLPRHALEGENLAKIWTDRIDNPKTGQPIGSGPFLVESWVRGKELTLVRNPRYWGPHVARLDRLVIRFEIGDALEAFRKGDLDIAYGLFPPEVPPLLREPGLRVTAPPSAGWEQFAIRVGHGGHPALRNKLVRQALAYGIDRVALIRGLSEATEATRPLDSVVYLIQSPYHEPNWSRYRSRPAQARRLLEQAGCRRGADGIYSCGGRRLTLRFITTAGVPPREVLLTLAQAQLRKVGIEVVPTYAAPQALLGTIIPSGNFEVALHGWVFDPNPSANFLFGCGGRFNWTGYCSRSVDRNLARAARTLDASAQARILNRVDVQLSKDVPLLPLFQIRFATALRKTVQNFVALPYTPLSDAENWWLER